MGYNLQTLRGSFEQLSQLDTKAGISYEDKAVRKHRHTMHLGNGFKLISITSAAPAAIVRVGVDLRAFSNIVFGRVSFHLLPFLS